MTYFGSTAAQKLAGGVDVLAPMPDAYAEILTPEALAFLGDLTRTFRSRIETLLERRRNMQARYDSGTKPDFLEATAHIRNSDWRVAPLPADLQDRCVEITGPVSRKMVINALNSGANVFMADFEDATAPSWDNQVQGQINLRDAVRGTIAYEDPRSGKSYALGDHPATLLVRPRGLHLPERHIEVDGTAMPGCLFDFGLYFFHNVLALLRKQTGPYFYLPKLQSHLEARLWNDVFLWAQDALGVPRGSVRATVLIETLPAAFEMDEILYELREHAAGLNCGRWDYIFSFIKTFRTDPTYVTPDRNQVNMEQPFMRAYTQLVVKTCHRRGASAIGGMAAQIPIKNDPEANEAALQKVRNDKLREVKDGHDGTWVAHPGLVAVAREVFDAHMHGPNQLNCMREDVRVSQQDLIAVPTGEATEEGLRQNIRVGIQYMAAWLNGQGCVPLYHLMEDAATAEISRTQVWQWVRHEATVGGAPLTAKRLQAVVAEELKLLCEAAQDAVVEANLVQAGALFADMTTSAELTEFITLPAYEALLEREKNASEAAAAPATANAAAVQAEAATTTASQQ